MLHDISRKFPFFLGGGINARVPPSPTHMPEVLSSLQCRKWQLILIGMTVWIELRQRIMAIQFPLPARTGLALYFNQSIGHFRTGIKLMLSLSSDRNTRLPLRTSMELVKKVKVKERIAFNAFPCHSYGTSLAIRDHTCHPTQVNASRLINPSQ